VFEKKLQRTSSPTEIAHCSIFPYFPHSYLVYRYLKVSGVENEASYKGY
jgi:hypothetical protein